MEIKYNIEKSQRKALAQKISELTGADVRYAGVPSCAYEIDFFTLSKDAVLSFSDRSDSEIVEMVLDGLADAIVRAVSSLQADSPEPVIRVYLDGKQLSDAVTKYQRRDARAQG